MSIFILKELRENFKWALLALAVFGSALLYALYPQNAQQDYYEYSLEGITLCRTSFLNVTTFGCAAIGFILGLLQILPELKRDRWATLLHRPVSRGVIYRGKAVAGLALYVMATVPPFLLAVWLAATPGHFPAPFVPEMVFPGTVDLCQGAVYYFAALALALQRGGWFGTRLLPVLAAIHATYFVLGQNFFYVAVEAVILMALALSTAAWGEMHNQELFRARPWLGKLAFLAALIYGVCGLGDLVRSFFNAVAPSPRSSFVQYELSDEGVPLRINYDHGGVTVAVHNLAGETVADPRYQPDRVRNHIKYLNRASEYIGDAHGYHRREYPRGYRETSTYLWANSPYAYPRLEQWFYLREKKVLIGFWPSQKQAFAVLDRQGFVPASARPESLLPGAELVHMGQDTYCLWQPTLASYAFLARRQMVDLALPAPSPLYGVTNAWASTEHGSVNIMGVALGSGMAVYDDKAALLALLPYHRPMDRWGQLSIGVAGSLDRFYLRYEPSEWINGEVRKTMPSYVEEMDRQGQVLHAYTLPPLPASPRPVSWDSFLSQRLQSPVFYFGTMLYKRMGAAFGSARMKGELAWQFGHDRHLTQEISLYVAALAVILAGTTLIWARRVYFSWARAWTWAGFVLAFSLPGFIAFRLSTDWPRLVACPRCTRGRPVDTASCPNCGVGWPEPPTTGIEIFDARPTETLAGASI